jgi:hypothetical protein
MAWLIWTMVWWGSAAAVIAADSQLRKRKRDANPDDPDLSDKSVFPWLMVAAIAGSFVFPIYFYVTRKSIGWGVVGLLLVPVFLYMVSLVTALLGLGIFTALS